ncbi:MAG: DUF2510 domain-containing protein [Ilumatobacter sp.]
MQDRPGVPKPDANEATRPAYTPGWYPDPSGAHDVRYHNGAVWTADVSDDGVRSVEPLVAPSGPRRSGTPAMVLGIVALATGWIPFVAFLSLVAGVAAVVMGLRRRRDPASRGAATAGLVTGSVGVLLAAAGIWVSLAFAGAIQRFEQPGAHVAVIESCVEVDNGTAARGTITNDSDQSRSYTITVAFDDEAEATVVVDDVEPGASVGFEAVENLRFDDLECRVDEVKGPRPFGLDLDG